MRKSWLVKRKKERNISRFMAGNFNPINSETLKKTMDNNLSSFTDILGDEIENSQPISLPSSTSSVEICPTTSSKTVTEVTNRPVKGTGQYGEFRSVDEIDPKYRNIFSHSFFNVVQSRVIDDALYSDKSMVICAPTGSGKTVIFEMAIVQLLMSLDDKNYTGDFKIVYMAPVKSLCTERLSEWYPKFTKLGLLCIEVTGDTDVDFSQLQPYRIIITTPEKWDMLTRRWRDHKSLVEVIKLFLIDEVHILNVETRGPVLEAVVSRMKTIESSVQSTHRIEQIQRQYNGTLEVSEEAPRIRFVAVSATVSNPEDVATWLGNVDKPAAFYKFGDECRPVKVKRIVEGYPCSEGTSIFKFDIILNYKLWPIIQKHHNGKPTLIFCNTRKSVVLTAETLSKELTINFNPEQKARLVALASTTKNKKLQSLIMSGVGCHHAGMLFEERINIEQAFRNRDLPILITTTTLAMGVNLPAHLVIIKNTQQYVNGAYQEYSISTVLQMVGRAGRPQFDTEATAVIMTRLADKHRYQALVGGNEPLQSFLHKRLTENLNSEAALGTVGDVAQCVQWLRSTFLFVRAARDPRRYLGLPPSAPQTLIAKKIEELCVKAMNGLASSGLITMDEASCIESTDAGRLMSIYYLDVETMKNIMKIDGTETLESLLSIVCESHEMSDMHLRVDERRCLNALNRNNTAATIRFPMKGKISTRQMKLNCIIQAILGCLPISDPSLNQEAMKVMRVADRICKCLVAYVTRPDLISQQPQYFSTILNSIVLAKCVTARLWENSSFVSKQLKGIGPTFSTLLATSGKVNFMLLEESHPRDLERIMNKGPPAGNTLRKQISLLPKYQLTITPKDERTISIQLDLQNLCYLLENMEHLTAGQAHKAYIIVGDSDNYLLLLASFKDKDLISIYDGSITYEITRKRNCEHKIFAHCVSSNFVGIDAQCEFVFKDLETPVNVNAEMITKTLNQKQTCITDMFKQRKRKNESILKTPQSKEKRPRDCTVLQKFAVLKEPFNQTFDMLNKNIGGTKVAFKSPSVVYDNTSMSNISAVNNARVLPTDTVKSDDAPKTDENILIDFSISEMNIEEDIGEEYIDDEKINYILDNIESEISKINIIPRSEELSSKPQQGPPKVINENTINQKVEISTYKSPQLNWYKLDMNRQMSRQPRSNFETNKNMQTKTRKTKNVKSNYSFMDKLEKNYDFLDDKDTNADNGIGFSSTIKSNLDKYLETVHHSSSNSNNALNDLLPSTETNKRTPSLDLIPQHPEPTSTGSHTPKGEIHSDQTYKSFTQHKIDNQMIKTVHNILQNDSTISNNISPQNEKITDKIAHSNDLDDNVLVEALQHSSSLKSSVEQIDPEPNKTVERLKCISDDACIDNLNNKTNYLNQDSQLQNMKAAKKFELVHEKPIKDKVIYLNSVSLNGQASLVNANEPNQLQRNLINNEKYDCITNSISKYLFTATTMSVRGSPNDLFHVIKKLKVNVDITKTISTNKLNNEYEIISNKPEIYDKNHKNVNIKKTGVIKAMEYNDLIRAEAENIECESNVVDTLPKCIAYDELQENNVVTSLKEEHYNKHTNINTKMFCSNIIPTICEALLKGNSSISENIGDIEHNDGILAKSNKTENTLNVMNTTPKCITYDKLGVMQTSSTNDEPKDICSSIGEQFYEDTIEDNKHHRDVNFTEDSFRINPIEFKVKKTDFNIEISTNKTVSPECEGNEIADILKKYSTLISNNKNNQDSNINPSSIRKSYKRHEIKKPDRPFNISDIQNLDIDLPQECISESHAKNIKYYFPKLPNVTKNEDNCTGHVSHSPYVEHNVQTDNCENTNIEDEDQAQWKSTIEQPEEQACDFSIHESMFDPRTLLQCLDNNYEIIPPPPEFRDDLDKTYSTEEIITHTYSPRYDIGYHNGNNSIFSEYDNLELTPCKEIETWILSPENSSNYSALSPTQTCTTLNRPVSMDGVSYNPISRRNRLNEFKFEQKKKMKI